MGHLRVHMKVVQPISLRLPMSGGHDNNRMITRRPIALRAGAIPLQGLVLRYRSE
jgi:hypothetical protein